MYFPFGFRPIFRFQPLVFWGLYEISVYEIIGSYRDRRDRRRHREVSGICGWDFFVWRLVEGDMMMRMMKMSIRG